MTHQNTNTRRHERIDTNSPHDFVSSVPGNPYEAATIRTVSDMTMLTYDSDANETTVAMSLNADHTTVDGTISITVSGDARDIPDDELVDVVHALAVGLTEERAEELDDSNGKGDHE